MRLIDNKGRLFGLVNLIDLFVMALIIVLIASFASNPLLRVKAKSNKNIETEIKILFANIPDEVASSKKVFREGDIVLGGNAVVKRAFYTKSEKPGYSDVTVVLKASCIEMRGELYCANAPVKINSICPISNPVYEFEKGVILDVVQIKKGPDDAGR